MLGKALEKVLEKLLEKILEELGKRFGQVVWLFGCFVIRYLAGTTTDFFRLNNV
jgi:hypothetical protein